MLRYLLFFALPLIAAAGVQAQSLVAPAPAEMAVLCKDTQDLPECGRKVEDLLLPKSRMVRREDLQLVVVRTDGSERRFSDSGGAEGGERFRFFGYNAEADCVVLYHTKADKLDFLVVPRSRANATAVPNDPVFSADGLRFVTADVCSSGCEQKIAVWRFERAAAARELELGLSVHWTDASVSWDGNEGVNVELSGEARAEHLRLPLTDRRWKLLLL